MRELRADRRNGVKERPAEIRKLDDRFLDGRWAWRRPIEGEERHAGVLDRDLPFAGTHLQPGPRTKEALELRILVTHAGCRARVARLVQAELRSGQSILTDPVGSGADP